MFIWTHDRKSSATNGKLIGKKFGDYALIGILPVYNFIRARAPPVGGPIVFRRICISLLGLFQGLHMLKLLPTFAGNSKPQKVIESKLDM